MNSFSVVFGILFSLSSLAFAEELAGVANVLGTVIEKRERVYGNGSAACSVDIKARQIYHNFYQPLESFGVEGLIENVIDRSCSFEKNQAVRVRIVRKDINGISLLMVD